MYVSKNVSTSHNKSHFTYTPDIITVAKPVLGEDRRDTPQGDREGTEGKEREQRGNSDTPSYVR